MTVEDILEALWNIHWQEEIESRFTEWLHGFIISVYQHTRDGKPLSTAQSKVILSYGAQYRELLISVHGLDAAALDIALRYPSHRMPPYQSTKIPREVRHVGDNKLAFRFKFDNGLVEEIKQLKPKTNFNYDQFPTWKPKLKIWIVSINRENVERVMKFISKHRFGFDHAVVEYLTLCLNSRTQNSSFVLDPKTNKIAITVCDNEFLGSWVACLGAAVV